MAGHGLPASLVTISKAETLQSVSSDAGTSLRLWMACVGELARMLLSFCPKVAAVALHGCLSSVQSLLGMLETAPEVDAAVIGTWTNQCVFACSLTDLPGGFAKDDTYSCATPDLGVRC